MASYLRSLPRISGTRPCEIEEMGAAREGEEMGNASKRRRVAHVRGGDECCVKRRIGRVKVKVSRSGAWDYLRRTTIQGGRGQFQKGGGF